MSHALKVLRFAVLLPAMAMSKCPVTSDTPIAEASSEAFDRRIPGTWRCMSQDEDSVFVLRLEPRTPTQLAILYEDNGKTDSMVIHSGKLAGKKVGNMVTPDKSGTKPEWNVVRLNLLQANVLQMDMLVGDLPDTLSRSARTKAIERLVKEGSFGEFLLCALKSDS